VRNYFWRRAKDQTGNCVAPESGEFVTALLSSTLTDATGDGDILTDSISLISPRTKKSEAMSVWNLDFGSNSQNKL
jgi:hypothetical protein